jgi:pimeloyl-ACP methyl ester carboxylesterase
VCTICERQGPTLGMGGLRVRRRQILRAALALGVLASLSWAPVARAAPSAVSTPIRTVGVPWGKIGYRALGHGRPLVLVVGYSDSIDEWAPRFIDALARHHRVFAFDNEGVGRTTLRGGALTISRMGDDTAAFIAALGLRRPDVLGWSMGGDIVEALAVRHPRSVRRIILSATGPGDGSGLPPSGLRTSPPYANFFPPDQDAARLAFIADLRRYRGFYSASRHVDQLQTLASDHWAQGLEPAGHQLGAVRAPALIADGAEDPNPLANSRRLQAEIPNAQLHIYPDAAHGFWFQDATDWVQRIDRFLR